MAKKLKITQDLLNTILVERIAKFNKVCTSEKLKKIINTIPIIVYVDNRTETYLGYADTVKRRNKKDMKRYKINSRKSKSYFFEDDNVYFLIGVCTKLYKFNNNKSMRMELTDTIAHELGHILEFFIHGYEERVCIFHTKTWKRFARLFGCRNVRAVQE